MVVPDSILIITPEEAMIFLGLKSKPDDYPIIELIVLAIDKLVKNHCRRCFNKVTGAIEYLDGDGSQELWLEDYPVSDVILNIDYDEDQVFEDADILDIEDYVVYPDIGKIYYGAGFPIGNRNVKAIYNKGFADVDMPEDLKLVCRLEVRILHGRWKEESQGLENYSLAGINKTFNPTLSPISLKILDGFYVKQEM